MESGIVWPENRDCVTFNLQQETEMRIRYHHPCVFAAVLGATLALAPITWAQDNCRPFRALIQATWVDPLIVSSGYGWQGRFMGTLDGQPVAGMLSPASPTPGPGTMTGVAGKEGSPSEKLVFTVGPAGSFTTAADNKGVFPLPPGKGGFLMGYSETAKIAEGTGTGKYAYASGFLAISGPGIAYPADLAKPDGPWIGIWNGEITGRICNIAR
jgi:hypothetical protein